MMHLKQSFKSVHPRLLFRNFPFYNTRMKKIGVALIGFFCLAQAAQAQPGRYLIQLRDKAQNPYSLSQPQGFLSPRSMERRTRYGIPYDSTDLPVSPRYIDSLRTIANVTVLNVSKWFNQVSVQVTNNDALIKIRQLPFVQSAVFVASKSARSKRTPEDLLLNHAPPQSMQASGATADTLEYGASAAQVTLHNGQFLHNIGLQGQDMIVSLLDAGFYHYTTLKVFDSVNQNRQVLGTWDFVAREENVVEDHPHGMQCFSVMAANLPDTFVGTAPKAGFYLFRSEDAASEYEIEEHMWVCAAERADSAGSDVISSSLGYTVFDDPSRNHTYSDLNGDRTLAAIGADLAAKKGLLVVVAAGNEGNKSWKYIVTPADGDSVLAVGAVNKAGVLAPFSSYGPTVDGRIKPDVVSVGSGTVIQGTNNNIVTGNGTSFACPNIAGLATCLWQGFPEYGNIKIMEALRRSAHLFQTPNDSLGYGIPDVKKAAQTLLHDYATVSISDCKTINWTSKDAGSMHYEIERQKSGETGFIKIGDQNGTGTVFGPRTYQFTDTSLTIADGPVRYRIRQVLDTATSSLSAFYIDTVTISLALSCTPVPASEGNIHIVPNPVLNRFYIKMDTEVAIANLRLVIINGLGQTVYTKHASKEAGIAVIPIEAAGLARGVYYVLVYDGQKKLAAKTFVKLRL
jgi:hypothetical protein